MTTAAAPQVGASHSHGERVPRSIHDLRVGDHWCELYHQDQEHLELLKAFFRDGFEQNHRVLYVAEPEVAARQFEALAAAGLDLDARLRSGQFVTLSPAAAYLVNGRFDMERMLRQWQQDCDAALAAGYAALRAAGEPTWALGDVPGGEDLATYESRLNQFAATHPCLIFCQYDARRFPPKILLDVLSSHPVAVLDNTVIGNPCFIPPDQTCGEPHDAARLSRLVTEWHRQHLDEQRQAAPFEERRSPGAARAGSALLARLTRLSLTCALLANLIAVVVLAGYWLDQPLLASFLPAGSRTRPNAAAGFLVLSLSLILLLRGATGRMRILGRLSAVVAALIGAATAVEHVFGWQLAIDNLLFSRQAAAWDAFEPGRMSLPAAVSLLLLGVGLLCSSAAEKFVRVGHWLAALALLLNLVSLQGITFEVAALASFGKIIWIGLPAALAGGLLSLGILLARPRAGFMAVLSSEHAGGAMLRWFLPTGVGAICLLSWASVYGAHRGWYREAVDQVVLSLPLMVIFTVILLRLARALNAASEAEAEQRAVLQSWNRELERRVEHRTAELRREEERYRSLVTATSQVIWHTDASGQVVGDLPLWRQFTGATVDELRGWGWINSLHPDDRQRTAAIWEAATKQGAVYDTEYRLLRADGEYRDVAVRGVPVREPDGTVREWIGACTDITERKRVERELRRLNRAHKALSRCTDAITRAVNEGELLQQVCNLAVQVGGYRLVWVGYAQDDADKSVLPMAFAGMGEDFVASARISWGENERGLGPTGIAIRTGRPHFIADIEHAPCFAPWRERALAHGYKSVMTAPLKDGDRAFGTVNFYAGEPDAFDPEERGLVVELAATLSYAVLALRARLERDRAAAELRLLNETLEERVAQRTQQLAVANHELEAFTYSVAHDLRTPLRHMHGFVTLLAEDYGTQLDEEGRNYITRIVAGSQHMGHLIDDLLNLSRVGRQQLAPQIVGLGRVVEEARAHLQAEAAGREIEWRVDELPFVECDPALIRQVFENLIANALKFTRPRRPAAIEIGAHAEAGETVFFVRDNGVGFNMKYADKLFGVFQRLHRVEDFEGTGVGLATVQRIIQKHGGRVWAEAAIDHGATFYFTLPAESARPTPRLEKTEVTCATETR